MKQAKREFKSIGEFENFINTTPLNDVCRWHKLDSVSSDVKWTGTQSFEEAMKLLKTGWDDMAKKLETRLALEKQTIQQTTKQRMQYDVAGFQASVPRYLQGIPQSMVNTKRVPQKQKVITLVKNISYNSGISAEQIIENSVKALTIVKKIEAQGIRVNLDTIWIVRHNDEEVICRVRIKSAGERLNISKVAFPLVNPSMLRRLMFRFLEVVPEITMKSWTFGYGSPVMSKDATRTYLNADDYLLNSFISDVDLEIANMKLK